MAVRRLLPTCLALALSAAPLAALADKPKSSEDDDDAREKKKRAAEKKREAEKKKREAERKRREEEEKREDERRREAADEKREAERRRAEERRRVDEQRRREAEQRQVESSRRAAERQRLEERRRAEAKRDARARREAEERARRDARAAREAEAARRVAEQRREAEQRRAAEQRREARQRREAEQLREAEQTRRRFFEARAADAARREAEARAAEARKLEAARREADARREAEARAAEAEAARVDVEARKLEAARREAAERRGAEDRATAAARLAEEARREAALERPPLPTARALPPAADAPADDGGAGTVGRGAPVRRPDADEPPGRRPIPRPDADAPDADEPDADDGGRPRLGRREPVPRPHPVGPRRGDRTAPGDSRDRWDETVDRVADAAGRPPPPAPIRHPRRDDPPGAGRDPYPAAGPGDSGRPRYRVMPDRPVEPDPQTAGAAPADLPPADRPADLTAAPVGRQQQALSAEADAPGGPGGVGPSPDIQVGARPMPTPTLDPPAERPASDWFDGFTARGAYAGWSFVPVGDLPGGAETFERYTAEGLDLYRLDAILDTRWARLQARYESNRGFSVGRDDALLDLLVGLRAVPGLEGLTFEYLDLDFVHGRVDLIDGVDGTVIETTPLEVDWRTIDVGYPISDAVRLFGRRFDTQMPRNVYLERAGTQTATQISEQLLEVEATAWAAGLAIVKADDGEGLFGGVEGWIGVGPYDIRTVSGGSFLDGGWLTAGGAEAHIGWRQPLGAGFSLGIHDTLTLVGLAPNGLPAGMERDLQARGLRTDDLSLRFGTLELLNGLHLDLTWSI